MMRKTSVHVQCRHNPHRPNYIVHVINNITFVVNILCPWLVESLMWNPQYGGLSVIQSCGICPIKKIIVPKIFNKTTMVS